MDIVVELTESQDLTPLDFCYWGWMETEVYKWKLDTWDEFFDRPFGCCCPHNETWRSTQTNNTRSSHTSCEVHWGWW